MREAENKTDDRNSIIVFIITFLTTLFILFGASVFLNALRFNRMIEASRLSARPYDGATNHIVMNGQSGFIGSSCVFLKYRNDGSIHIFGNNRTSDYQWKLIADMSLDSGYYTFGGLGDVMDETIKLQLFYDNNGTGSPVFKYLSGEDIHLVLDSPQNVQLHVMVYPKVTVDVVAKPTLYKES